MNFEEGMEKIDFLNDRLRKLKQPWFNWAINHSWSKVDKWCRILGYKRKKEGKHA